MIYGWFLDAPYWGKYKRDIFLFTTYSVGVIKTYSRKWCQSVESLWYIYIYAFELVCTTLVT